MSAASSRRDSSPPARARGASDPQRRGRLRAWVEIGGRRYRLEVEGSVEGDWRAGRYRGTFKLEPGRLELRLAASTMARLLLRGGRGRRLLDHVAELLGVRIVVRGPLGVKLAEAGGGEG